MLRLRAAEQSYGTAVSTFDYGQCLEAENCSVTQAFREHSKDHKVWDGQRAVLKACLMVAPVAVALLATQWHH
jgi:hypothetical protein